jgi:beta-xylosidase
VATAAALGFAALGVGINSDLHTRSELRQARSALKATRSQVRLTLRTLTRVEATLLRTAAQRTDLQGELAATSQDLASAQANLSSTQAGLSDADKTVATQGVDITVLNTCLSGVEHALNQIAVGDDGGAVTSISAVSTSCQALQGQGQGGPVFPFDFPDPDVIRVGGVYYGYATNSAGGNIQMIQSTDLAHWTVDGNALPHLASWAQPGDTWAPGVFELNGAFVLYYAAVEASSGKECISVAVATVPQGPFTDDSTAPLVCQLDLGGSIDPSPFFDSTGTPYLVWKSQGTASQAPAIWSQQLGANGLSLAGPAPHLLLQPSQPWEGGVVEGPFVLLWSGRYYLFYSANNWDTAQYAVGVALCQGPSGPCSKPLGHALVASQGGLAGPGGPSLFTDSNGTLWLAFHAWLPSAVGYPNNRFLFLRPVTFTGDLPVVQSAG